MMEGPNRRKQSMVSIQTLLCLGSAYGSMRYATIIGAKDLNHNILVLC